MPRSMTMTGPTRSAPRWAGESLAERLILAKLDAAAFPATTIGTVETAAGRVVVSGTFVGRTFAERDAGGQYGPFAAGDEDCGLIRYDVHVERNNDAELVPTGAIIKENYLPDWETLSAAAKAKLRAMYVTTPAVR